jgi:hypothetical protein
MSLALSLSHPMTLLTQFGRERGERTMRPLRSGFVGRVPLALIVGPVVLVYALSVGNRTSEQSNLNLEPGIDDA